MTIHTPPQIEETLLKGYDANVVSRLLPFFKPYRVGLLISLILMLMNSAAAVSGPYFVKMAVDSGMEANSINGLRNAVILYLGAITIQWISIYLRVNIMVRAGQSIIYDLRNRLFEHLQVLSLGFFTRFSVGRIITRVINDVSILREFVTWALLAVARDFFTVIGTLIAIFLLDKRLALIAVTVMPLMIGLTVVFRRQARRNYRRVRAAISWVNSVLAENINAVRVVQAFSRQKTNYEYFHDHVNYNNLSANLQAARIAAGFPAGVDLLGALAISLVIWFGGAAVLNRDPTDAITPGMLVAFILYIDRLLDPIRDLSQRYDSFQSTMAGGERILALLDTPAEVEDAPDAKELPLIRGQVTFENVFFHYPEDPEWVLEEINLNSLPGETIALVGTTGAGKSTLVKLIGRFYDPTKGRVCIDGADVKTITQKSLRSQMGIVLQDPFLFSGTVADNIRFGRLDAADQEIVNAAVAIGADVFISHLRLGYDTPVEEGGVVLSVGQRQLISFARAMLADPRILILDEATSSIDTQTEKIIQSALERLFRGRTSFVIAHRLSTIVNADRIIVIENGRILEEGTHSQLMAKGGHYYSLYREGFNP